MREVLMYSIEKKLYLHSHQIIKDGLIQLIDACGKVVKEYPVENTDFESFQLELKSGKYFARFLYEDMKLEKSLIIS